MFMLTLFESKKTRVQRSHLKNLILLAKADGNISDAEMKLIFKAGVRFGLKEWEIANLLENARVEEFEMPLNDAQRYDQIFELVQMMVADGQIDDAEMDFCIYMAGKLGFRKAIVGILVRKISLGLNMGRTKDGIKSEVESFLVF